MANLDPFTAKIVEYVRSLPDEALLELVRAHLGSGGAVQLVSGGTGQKRGGVKRAVTAAAAPAPKQGRKKTRGKRASAEERQEILETVEGLVKKSRGVSSSEVAKKAGVPKSRVTAALRELKSARRIFQGGERRFARYAADAKTAKNASLRARKTASGPQR